MADGFARRLTWMAAATAGLAVLLAPAIYNHFPISFYDTGGYIERWFDHTVMMGRSLVWGLFLGVSAGGLSADGGSLWGTVAVQAALTVWLLHVTARAVAVANGPLALVLTVVVLAVTTGLPWYTAQVMPDILEPLMVLALFLLGFRRPALSRGEAAGLAALVALSVASAMAHLALALGLMMVLALVKVLGRLWRRSAAAVVVVALGWPASAVTAGVAALLAVNAGLAGHAGFTPGGESFVFGRLVQDGIVQRFLDDHCPSPAYRLCAYRDRMPRTAGDWIWGDSPFEAIGGWQSGGEEMGRIAWESLHAYPREHLITALTSTWNQLIRVQTGDGLTEWLGHTTAMFRERLPGHYSAYLASRQQRKELGFAVLNRFQVPLALGAVLVLGPLSGWLAWRRRGVWLAGLGGFVLIALLGNAFICGTLSDPSDRYQNRLVWLAAFCLILVGRLYWQWKTKGSVKTRDRRWPALAMISAVALAVGMAVGAGVLGGLRPPPAPDDLAVAWTSERDHQLHRGWLPVAAYAAFRLQREDTLDSACQKAGQGIEQTVAAQTVPLFAALKERVPAYAEWLFGWSLSYDRDRQLLGTALGTIYQHLRAGEVFNAGAGVEQQLSDQIKDAFRTIVVKPEEVDSKVALAWSRSAAAAEEAWNRIAGDDHLAILAFLGGHVRPDGGVTGTLTWLTLPAAPQPGTKVEVNAGQGTRPAIPSPPSSMDILNAIQDPSGEAMIRTPRPVLARIVGVGLRSAVGLSTFSIARTIMDVTDLGLIVVLPGLAAGFATAIVTSMGLDFAIASTDEALNRRDFETRLIQTLDHSQEVVARDWTQTLRESLGRRCHASIHDALPFPSAQ